MARSHLERLPVFSIQPAAASIWSDLQDKLIALQCHPSSSGVVSHFDIGGRRQRLSVSTLNALVIRQRSVGLGKSRIRSVLKPTEQLQMQVMYNYYHSI